MKIFTDGEQQDIAFSEKKEISQSKHPLVVWNFSQISTIHITTQ